MRYCLVFQYVNILHIENNKGYYSVCKPNSLLICYITYYGHLYIYCLTRNVESYVPHKPLISVLWNWQKALLLVIIHNIQYLFYYYMVPILFWNAATLLMPIYSWQLSIIRYNQNHQPIVIFITPTCLDYIYRFYLYYYILNLPQEFSICHSIFLIRRQQENATAAGSATRRGKQ
jgi:hypothetical protein